jgi:hypothetical protein
MNRAERRREAKPVTDERYVIRGVTDGEPWALDLFEQYMNRRLGPDPLAEGDCHWPEWASSVTANLPADQPLQGWRWWSLVATKNGPRLAAPFLTAIHREPLALPGVEWLPGINTNSTRHCSLARFPQAMTYRGTHPLVACACGIRAMQSLTALRKFHEFGKSQEPAVGPLLAYARVDLWGHVAPPARDDWRYTVRAEFASIDGPLHLAPTHAHHAAALSAFYGVEVQRTDEAS